MITLSCDMQIPLVMFLLTHAYFCLYHALSNILIRRCMQATVSFGKLGQRTTTGCLIFALAYATAYMETLTIAQVRPSNTASCAYAQH